MHLYSSFKAFLVSRFGWVAEALRVPPTAWAPRRAAALVPIPIRAVRHARRAAGHGCSRSV